MEMPANTCSPNDPVFDDIQLVDSLGAVVTTLRATECNGAWFAEAAPFFGMFGPNYPLTWRHAPPEVGTDSDA